MWPWEHVAIGYVAYSLFARLAYRRPPRGDAAVAVALVALVPDLVDKPLAWGAHVLPSGRSLAHSLLFAVPAVVLSVLATGRRLGVAIALTYVVHLGGDVVYPAALGQPFAYRFLLWPLVAQPPTETPGLLFHVGRLFDSFLEFLATTRGRFYLFFEFGLLVTTVLIWIVDGCPGPAAIRGWLRSAREEPQRT